MRILQINTHDLAGGAAKLTYQLHRSLHNLGHASRMLVGHKTSSDPDVFSVLPDRGNLQRRLQAYLENILSVQYWMRRFPYGWLDKEPLCSAEVVNIHNIHGGYFNYLALPRLTAAKPICWSLHDMWAFTGHCAYSYDCERWKTGCYQCPLLRLQGEDSGLVAPDATLFDLSRLIWNTKKRLYSHSRLTIVVGSTWMKQQVGQSILADYATTVHIPDGADIEQFRPIDRVTARQSLDIPLGVPAVLVYVTPSNPRKGLRYAVEALHGLRIEPLPWIISVGHVRALDSLKGQFSIRDLGVLESDTLRNLAYCAADLFLLPTLADNLPLTVLDSLASGTPIVAFNTGGIPDAVHHMETGYLAAYKDTQDLTFGIQLILEEPDLRAKMSLRCREVAERDFTLKLQAQRYAELYEALIEAPSQQR